MDDNIFTPVSYFLGGRKALKKYLYIREALDGDDDFNIYISYKNSSLPISLTKYLPKFIFRIIVFLEVYFWLKLNNVDRKKIAKSFSNKNVFCFGYKKFDRFTHDEVRSARTFNIHITHYHTYSYNSIYLESNVNLLYDSDVKNHTYFKRKFINYTKSIIVMPFYVQDRFYNTKLSYDRSGIAITGTYHDISPFESDFGIYNNGRVTLHPLRHHIATNIEKYADCDFKIRLSLYSNPNSLIALFKKLRLYKQENYFSFDICDFYSSSKFSLIAGEGTGSIAIGSLEAMATGCLPILTEHEVKGLNIPSDAFFQFDGINFNHDALKNIHICHEDIREIARKFNYENSLLRYLKFYNEI
ncbi:hypothetical protein V9N58_002940 [Vibrio cholerae]